MTEYEKRLERFEDALLELAEAVEDGEIHNVSRRIGEILFDVNESL